MAMTGFSTSSALTVHAWHEKLLREVMKSIYFEKFTKQGIMSPVYLLKDLAGAPGDTINYQLQMRLTGAGVGAGEFLREKEEPMNFYNDQLTLIERRNAVIDNGALSRQRTKINVSAEAAEALKVWMAEMIDKDFFVALQDTLTKCFWQISGTVAAGTAAAGKAAITVAANSYLTPALLQTVKAWALTGGNRQQPPLEPIMIDGKPHFIYIGSPDTVFDLKRNSEMTQYIREAEVRGKENPIFSGADMVLDGIIIHSHENIDIASDGGAGAIPWSKGLFMGANAAAFGWAREGKPAIKTALVDYDEYQGTSIRGVYGVKKCAFNSADYGVLGIVTSRTTVSSL